MMSTNKITQSPLEIAALVLNCIARAGGELWLFSFEAREMADAIEIRPEIAVKLQSMAKQSEAMEVLWSQAKAVLDSRAAARAIDALLT